jgi:ribosomal protein S18 acetylase RimI-like enzyme
VQFRIANLEDLDRIAALEEASYPADEAASPKALKFRIRDAADCFWVAADDAGVVQGFVCGTLSAEPSLSHESMRSHDPEGRSLCVHSVVVAEDQRRTGLGTQLLLSYLRELPSRLPDVEQVLLICKEHLQGFYAGAGFELVGPSPVVHGLDPWFEMRCPLGGHHG